MTALPSRLRSLALALAAAASLLAGGACNKPTKDECRKAIENMRGLLGTDHLDTDVEGEVRRCNGGSKKEAVMCATNAKTLDELRACKFMHVPDNAGSGSAAGSANAGTAGSAAAGSDSGSAGSAAGSADAGAAMGSAVGSAAGSATDSAAGSAP